MIPQGVLDNYRWAHFSPTFYKIITLKHKEYLASHTSWIFSQVKMRKTCALQKRGLTIKWGKEWKYHPIILNPQILPSSETWLFLDSPTYWKQRTKKESEQSILLNTLKPKTIDQNFLKLTKVSPERTSKREIKLCPSLRSSYRSFTCFRTYKENWIQSQDAVFFQQLWCSVTS